MNEHYADLPAELQGQTLRGGPVQVLRLGMREQIQHGDIEMVMKHINFRGVHICLCLSENKLGISKEICHLK